MVNQSEQSVSEWQRQALEEVRTLNARMEAFEKREDEWRAKLEAQDAEDRAKRAATARRKVIDYYVGQLIVSTRPDHDDQSEFFAIAEKLVAESERRYGPLV